ncbi:MAG TPA: hypothetical protein PKK18_10190 [Chitinophagales bacterium]|nr:hypothetical protein [Chitinophagales bacterium]HMX61229.1 hypothetical protein [Chitinophagales bacterium]HMY23791.1 hypothetical protein [Chitinophagales bacterium]HMZ34727.1 hypothetical protein [Chitinophagales bacterium]HNA39787.1 hypothetical protein [Chitinophagales bacterium]
MEYFQIVVFLKVRFFLYILIACLPAIVQAQSAEIVVNVKIVDENNNIVPYADIAFRRLQLGFSASKEGFFSTKMLKSDSLIILKKGHVPSKLSCKDSVLRASYDIVFVLPRIPVELTEVQISAIRTHQQIRDQINNLYIKNTAKNPDARPFTNPISYLYQLLSKHEKEKKVAAQLETEEAKRIVLKDLFRLYNNYHIIDLDEDEYDRFISYLNMPYTFLQQTSDYDLAVNIKRMYAGYNKDKSSSFRKQIYPAALDDMEFIKHKPTDER